MNPNIATPLLFAFVFIIAKDRGILEAGGSGWVKMASLILKYA